MNRHVRLRGGPYDGNEAVPYSRDRLEACAPSKGLIAGELSARAGDRLIPAWTYERTPEKDPGGLPVYVYVSPAVD